MQKLKNVLCSNWNIWNKFKLKIVIIIIINNKVIINNHVKSKFTNISNIFIKYFKYQFKSLYCFVIFCLLLLLWLCLLFCDLRLYFQLIDCFLIHLKKQNHKNQTMYGRYIEEYNKYISIIKITVQGYVKIYIY